MPQEYYELRPKTKAAFAFRDISKQEVPTRIYTKGEGIRDAKIGEDLKRTWTRNPRYIDTIPLDNPGYNPNLSAGIPSTYEVTGKLTAADEDNDSHTAPPYDDSD